MPKTPVRFFTDRRHRCCVVGSASSHSPTEKRAEEQPCAPAARAKATELSRSQKSQKENAEAAKAAYYAKAKASAEARAKAAADAKKKADAAAAAQAASKQMQPRARRLSNISQPPAASQYSTTYLQYLKKKAEAQKRQATGAATHSTLHSNVLQHNRSQLADTAREDRRGQPSVKPNRLDRSSRSRVSQESMAAELVRERNRMMMRRERLDYDNLPNTLSLSVNRFGRYVSAENEGTSTRQFQAPSIFEAAAPTSTTIDAGEEIELEWRIRGRNVSDVQVALSGVAGAVDPGTSRPQTDGSFSMYNRVSIAPEETTTYTLTVTAVATQANGSVTSLRREATFTVEVRAGCLELCEPEFIQSEKKIRLFVQNTGEADIAPRRLSFWYAAESIPASRSLARNSAQTPVLAVAQGERVQVAEITLPDRALAFESVGIRAQVTADGGLDTGVQTFTEDWELQTATLELDDLSTLISLLGMSVRINNFDASRSGDELSSAPLLENDSQVVIAGRPFEFNIPTIAFEAPVAIPPFVVVNWDFRAFINNIESMGEPELLLADRNRLGFRLHFDVSGGHDVKVYRLRRGEYRDNAPDLDISHLNLVLYFPIGVNSGQLCLNSDIELSVDMAAGLEDRGDSNLITNLAKDRLESSVAHVLNSSAAVRREINDALAQIGRLLAGNYVTEVTMDGETIIVTYR